MFRGKLTLVNLALVAGLAVAAADGFAQVAPTTDGGTGITATICGPGTIEECGYRDLTECSFRVEFNIAMLAYTGGFVFAKQECKVVGKMTLYKDRPNSGLQTCSASGISTGRKDDEPLDECAEFGYDGYGSDDSWWW